MEVRAVEELTDLVPELWFADEHATCLVKCRIAVSVKHRIAFCINDSTPLQCFPPEICEAGEEETFHAEQVVDTPDNGEL